MKSKFLALIACLGVLLQPLSGLELHQSDASDAIAHITPPSINQTFEQTEREAPWDHLNPMEVRGQSFVQPQSVQDVVTTYLTTFTPEPQKDGVNWEASVDEDKLQIQFNPAISDEERVAMLYGIWEELHKVEKQQAFRAQLRLSSESTVKH